MIPWSRYIKNISLSKNKGKYNKDRNAGTIPGERNKTYISW